MDVYNASSMTPEGFGVDDLLNFPSEEVFSISTTDDPKLLRYQDNTCSSHYFKPLPPHHYSSTAFTHDLSVPDDDVAELEWLSNFVDDSFTYSSSDFLTGFTNFHSGVMPSNNTSRSKRSRPTLHSSSRMYESDVAEIVNPSHDSSKKKEIYSLDSSSITKERSEEPLIHRKCSHCASENTPQWRTGPLGPKTLCNACGVRYKSGRLVPEYRPAASPTFVLAQHSNSHRKVMELRRQKEMLLQQQEEEQKQEVYGHRHRQVC